jgi:hypothetical protein
VTTLSLCVVCLYYFPDLRKDGGIAFSTVSGFATIYGVIFAIIEVLRAKAAIILARDLTQRVLTQVHTLQGVQKLSECQAAIEFCIEIFDRGERLPLSAIAQVVKIYSVYFHSELLSPNSEHRKLISILESYAMIRGVKYSAGGGNIRKAFVQMTRQLSVASGKTTSSVATE